MKYGSRRVLTGAHIAELSAAVGTDGLITAQSQSQTYECDGLTNFRVVPGAVVLPRNAQQVQAVVRLCAQHRIPFVSRGAGTGLMDRLARNLDDLRKTVLDLTRRGVHVQFVKENLTFTGEDSPMSSLLLSLLGAVAEFERSMIRERQQEGIALAKKAGVYKGRNPSLTPAQLAEIRSRAAAGEKKAGLANEYGVSRQTLYTALGP